MNTHNNQSTRLYFVDNLRIFVIGLVIAHHAAQSYGPTGGSWPIFDPERSALLGPFFPVNAAFFMGLLFLLSGYFVPRSYERKGAAAFLKGRFLRLGIPLLFFAVFVFGPIAYFGQDARLSFGEFVRYLYGTGWQDLYAHLWFVLHLLVYGIGYILWRQFARRDTSSTQPKAALPTHGTILMFTLALAIVTWIVRIWYPIDRWVAFLFLVPSEIAHLPQYASLFIIGMMASRADWLRKLPTATGMIWLGIGLVAAAARYAYQLVGRQFLPSLTAGGGLNWRSFFWSTWEAFICIGLCVGLLTLFREYFNKQPGKLLSAMAGASYGAYIIHLFVVVAIQMGLHTIALPPFVKFALVTLIGVPLSFGIAHLVRQVPGAKKIL
jgi:surface polysaccharide O-acyltransferase-like enzyme